jgi:hypothetical protein
MRVCCSCKTLSAIRRSRKTSVGCVGRMATVDELIAPAIFLSSQAASFLSRVRCVCDLLQRNPVC